MSFWLDLKMNVCLVLAVALVMHQNLILTLGSGNISFEVF